MTLNKKVIFICGAPHSGSTLLGLILGSHSKCFYTGELNKIKVLNSLEEHEDKYCKICGPNCPIWNNFTLDDEIGLYNQLSEKTNKPNIIDSTKNIDWLKTQLKKIENSNSKLYLIYILRDGRAVINSIMRKYKNSEPTKVIDNWINHIKATDKYYEDFPGKKTKIHYESLASKPEDIIKELCNFLDISYENSMIKYFLHKHHPLGGNTGTQFLIIKAQENKENNSNIHLSERNEYYYSDHPLDIKLDLRWKEELSLNIKLLFEEKAGDLNKSFRWEN